MIKATEKTQNSSNDRGKCEFHQWRQWKKLKFSQIAAKKRDFHQTIAKNRKFYQEVAKKFLIPSQDRGENANFFKRLLKNANFSKGSGKNRKFCQRIVKFVKETREENTNFLKELRKHSNFAKKLWKKCKFRLRFVGKCEFHQTAVEKTRIL